MPSKLPRVRTAILAGLAALSLGGVATAAFALSPASAGRAAHTPPGSSAGKAAASAHGAAASLVSGPDAGGAANAAGNAGDHATGPDASGAARHGLCQAWASGQGDDHGRRSDAPAFEALADAAGGADQVAAYCAAETASSDTHGQRPASPPGGDEHGNPSPPTTGPPADPGNGQGQGQSGPPTTA